MSSIKSESRSDGGKDYSKYLLFVGFTAAISSLAYGFNISVIDGPQRLFENCSNSDYNASFFPVCVVVGKYWNIVVAAFCVGGLFGALASSALTSRFGRKKTLVFHNVLFIFGSLLFSLSNHLSLLIISRFITGLASGICTVVVPMYLGEIATNRSRGTVMTFHQGAIVIGIVIAQVFSLFLANLAYWRLLFGIAGMISVGQLALLPFCPESPKYLAALGRSSEARDVLCKLRESSDVSMELEAMSPSKEMESGTEPGFLSFAQLVRLKTARKSLIVGLVFHMVQQFSGINAVFYFASTLFNNVGLNAGLVSVVIGIFNMIMTGISIWMMDRAGRRPLGLFSAAGMAVGGLGMTLSFAFKLDIVVLVFALVFVGAFALGMGPVPWVIIGDIFPSQSVNAGVSLALGVNWTCNTIVALSLLKMAEALTTTYVFVPFTLVLVAFAIFDYMYIPETKGKPAGYL